MALERVWMNGCPIFKQNEECPHAEELFMEIVERIEQQRNREAQEVAQ